METLVTPQLASELFSVFRVVQVFTIAALAFFIALALTPFWLRILSKYKIGKQLRVEGAPVFHQLHKAKEGTPTMGGVIMWLTVLLITLGFWLMGHFFG